MYDPHVKRCFPIVICWNLFSEYIRDSMVRWMEVECGILTSYGSTITQSANPGAPKWGLYIRVYCCVMSINANACVMPSSYVPRVEYICFIERVFSQHVPDRRSSAIRRSKHKRCRARNAVRDEAVWMHRARPTNVKPYNRVCSFFQHLCLVYEFGRF